MYIHAWEGGLESMQTSYICIILIPDLFVPYNSCGYNSSTHYYYVSDDYTGLKRKKVIDYSPPNWNDFNKDGQEQYLDDLESEQYEIDKKFSHLLVSIFSSLEKKSPDIVEELIIFFRGHLGRMLDMDASKVVFSNLRAATSVTAIFDVIIDHCSFYNFELIEMLIEEKGNEEDKVELRKYIEEFKDFCITVHNNRVVNCGCHPPGTKKIIFKLNVNKNVLRATVIKQIQRRISAIIGVHSSQLYLCHIRKGCLELEFSVSQSICKKIEGLRPEVKRILFSDDISCIEIQSSFEVWSLHL